MEKTIFAILLMMIAAILLNGLAVLLRSGGRELIPDHDGPLPYTRKKYVLTPAEFRFYKALRAATGDRYLIAPQVHLGSLVAVNRSERNWQKYHNMIDRKSVDFVLFDKDTVVALLAIELDDRSHQEEKRRLRDEFVNRIFSLSDLKLARIRAQADYDINELRDLIFNLLPADRTVKA